MMISNPTRPFVTVLMACYNADKWLQLSIPSVLNQTYSNFEFIIVNDGSSDNTLSVIQAFEATDPRIIVVSIENSGPGAARNMGVKIARGEWIAIIDSDDIFEPMKLEKQILEIDKNSNLVLIGTGLTIIDSYGNKSKTYSYPKEDAILKRNLRTARKFPPHSSIMYKTSTVQKLGGYHTRVSQAEDADLWLRLSDVGELTCIEGPYVQIRKHPDQISHFENGTRQMLDARIATVASWLRYHKQPDPISLDDNSFNEYYSWIKEQLTLNQLFEYLSYKSILNSKIIDCKFSLQSIRHLLYYIISNPTNSLRYLHEKLFGETLPLKLALKWIDKTSKVNF